MKWTCPQCGHRQQSGPICRACGAAQAPSESAESPVDEPSGATAADPAISPYDLPDSLFEPVIDLPATVAQSVSGERAAPMPDPGDPTGEILMEGEPVDELPIPPDDLVPRRPTRPLDPTQPVMSYQPQVVQEVERESLRYRRRRRRSHRTALLISGTVLAALLLAGFIFLVMMRPPGTTPEPSPNKTPSTADQAQLAALQDKAGELITRWNKMKLNPAYTSMAGQFAAIDAEVVKVRQGLRRKDTAALAQAIGALSSAMDRLIQARQQTLANQQNQQRQAAQLAALKAQAEDLASQVTQARDLARQAHAEQYVAETWRQAEAQRAQAAQAFEAGHFEQAIAGWQALLNRYARIRDEGAAAESAHHSRDELVRRREAQFTADQFKRHAPALWQANEALLAEGDALLEQHRYDLAAERYSQAMGRVQAMEQKVRRELGTKVYALHMGYLTTEVLLESAAGVKLTDEHFKKLKAVYAQLALSSDLLSDLPEDPAPSYEKVALYLAVKGRTAVQHERGKQVADCFALGFYLRMLKRMLRPAVDADGLTITALAEAKRLVMVIKRLAHQVGGHAKLIDFAEALQNALPTKTSDHAANDRCQEMLDGMIDKLMTFETAIDLVGAYNPPSPATPSPATPSPATPSPAAPSPAAGGS